MPTLEELKQQYEARAEAYRSHAVHHQKKLDKCKTLDELFDKGLGKLEEASPEQKEAYEYYMETMKTVYHDVEHASKSRVFNNNRVRREFEKECYDDYLKDNFIKNGKPNEKFRLGAEVARSVIPEYDFTKRAADLIREKQFAYLSTSATSRFFSYLNPFKNKYRTMRNEISAMKDRVIKASGCDKKELDAYTAGKKTDFEFAEGRKYSYETISLQLSESCKEEYRSIENEDFNKRLSEETKEKTIAVKAEKQISAQEKVVEADKGLEK